MRFFVALLFILSTAPSFGAEKTPLAPVTTPAEDNQQQQLFNEGVNLLRSGHPQEALDNHFDKIISFFEARTANQDTRFYSASSQPETLLYLLEAATSKTSARVVNSIYAYAYFLRGYALTELNRPSDAVASVESAIRMSPKNSQFLAERGHLQAKAKDWASSLATYQMAESAAKDFSAQGSKNIDLGRSLRGQGYVLVELHRLSDAEAVYQRCLQLDPNDRTAAAELGYVQRLIVKARN